MSPSAVVVVDGRGRSFPSWPDASSVDAYNAVAAMPDEPIVKYPRTPGFRPAPEDNRNNAWYRKSTVTGAASGKLKGKVVALKYNIMLAGVADDERSSTLEGFVPIRFNHRHAHAGAGAEIAGKCIAIVLHVGRQSHQLDRARAQPTQNGLLCGRIIIGRPSSVALGEVGYGDWRRPGGSIRMPSSSAAPTE